VGFVLSATRFRRFHVLPLWIRPPPDQYIANYSMGGRLVESTIDTDEGGELVATDFLRDRVLVTNPNVTSTRSPGYIRWGRHAGCDFVEQNARYWPEEYRCNSANQYGCSSDNRVASVCTLRSSLSSEGAACRIAGCPMHVVAGGNLSIPACILQRPRRFRAVDTTPLAWAMASVTT
jgi:hypothetical protein